MINNFMQIAKWGTKSVILSTIAIILKSIDALEAVSDTYDVFTTNGLIKMLSEQANAGKIFVSQAYKDFVNTTQETECPGYFNTDTPCVMYIGYVLDCRATGKKPAPFGIWLKQLKSGAAMKWYRDSEYAYYIDFDRFTRSIGDFYFMNKCSLAHYVTWLYMLRFEEFFKSIESVSETCKACSDLFFTRLAELEAAMNNINNEVLSVCRFTSMFDLEYPTII